VGSPWFHPGSSQPSDRDLVSPLTLARGAVYWARTLRRSGPGSEVVFAAPVAGSPSLSSPLWQP